jgi:hypothetical protein
MAIQLSQEVIDLAKAIEKAYKGKRSLTYQERDLHKAVGYVEQVVTETFIPNLIDPLDNPMFNREEVTWLASTDAAKMLLEE